MPEPSILDARLAEIDRRLRMIQSGLEPVRDEDPEPTVELAPGFDPRLPPPTPLHAHRPAPPELDERDAEIASLTAKLAELTVAHERLVAATQDLLVEQADMLARVAPVVALSAGPFADTADVDAFRSAVADLPGVHEVTLREYVGDERVVLDVQLRPGSPIS